MAAMRLIHHLLKVCIVGKVSGSISMSSPNRLTWFWWPAIPSWARVLPPWKRIIWRRSAARICSGSRCRPQRKPPRERISTHLDPGDPGLAADGFAGAGVPVRAGCGVPVHADVFGLCAGSGARAWGAGRHGAGDQTHLPLSSVGRLRS